MIFTLEKRRWKFAGLYRGGSCTASDAMPRKWAEQVTAGIKDYDDFTKMNPV
jgi:hypothetical protein